MSISPNLPHSAMNKFIAYNKKRAKARSQTPSSTSLNTFKVYVGLNMLQHVSCLSYRIPFGSVPQQEAPYPFQVITNDASFYILLSTFNQAEIAAKMTTSATI